MRTIELERVATGTRLHETPRDLAGSVDEYFGDISDRGIRIRCRNLEAWGRVVRRVQRWRNGERALAAIARIKREVERI